MRSIESSESSSTPRIPLRVWKDGRNARYTERVTRTIVRGTLDASIVNELELSMGLIITCYSRAFIDVERHKEITGTSPTQPTKKKKD